MNPRAWSAGLRQSVVVVTFTGLCVVIFGYLWVNSGGKIPFASSGYHVYVDIPRVGNLVYFSDVEIAGVKVGKVMNVSYERDHAVVEFNVNRGAAPLHSGATVQIGAKTLVEESYLNVADGHGATIPSGGTLPSGSGRGPVQLDDVYRTLDPSTRKNLSEFLRTAGVATAGQRDAISAAAQGIGMLGGDGSTALTALKQQSSAIDQLAANGAQVLAALDKRHVELSNLVDDASAIMHVTAGQATQVRAVINGLNDVMALAPAGGQGLTNVGNALAPVARNLGAAAPDLNLVLDQLPSTTANLRGLLPPLSGVLTGAGPTLSRVPTLSTDLSNITPSAEQLLSNVNPMLAYLAPFGPDMAAFFSNFGATLDTGDANGAMWRMLVQFSGQSFFGNPFNINEGPLGGYNPIPAAGSLQNPKTFNGTYPRVTKQAVPR
ncbi:MAG: Virulence factor Mce [Marmoricola sp.]|nr:Virulence factor Mce [Marmoricola sp.]